MRASLSMGGLSYGHVAEELRARCGQPGEDARRRALKLQAPRWLTRLVERLALPRLQQQAVRQRRVSQDLVPDVLGERVPAWVVIHLVDLEHGANVDRVVRRAHC